MYFIDKQVIKIVIIRIIMLMIVIIRRIMIIKVMVKLIMVIRMITKLIKKNYETDDNNNVANLTNVHILNAETKINETKHKTPF